MLVILLLHPLLVLDPTKTDCSLKEKNCKQNTVCSLGANFIEVILALMVEVITLEVELTLVPIWQTRPELSLSRLQE